MSLKKQESIRLLKEDLSKILIKNKIINRYSKSPVDRGGAENYLRGCGVNWSVSSDKILEDAFTDKNSVYFKSFDKVIDGKNISAKEIIKTKKRLNEIYAKHTDKKLNEIAKIMERDKYFSPHEAIKFGLIDKVVENRK